MQREKILDLPMNDIVEKLKADYDAVAYESCEHFHAHPERMAIVAALRGLIPPQIIACRVLEIACAGGGNLLPMAEQMPTSEFVGIDLAPRQIEAGTALIRELGLTNVELRCQDLMEFPEDAGTFDYIIAHGLYSWIPNTVRAQLMKLCRHHLSEKGLVFISYNTFPGWRAKGTIRDMMLYHARSAADSVERIKLGREIVQLVTEHTLQKGFYPAMVGEFNKYISDYESSYIFHDLMGTVNDPIYFKDFVNEAQRFGLTHLGECNATEDHWGRIPIQLRETISKISADAVERDQYMDFLMNRQFRRSVLCRSEAMTAANGSSASQIRKLYVAGNLTETKVGTNAAGRLAIQFGVENDQVQLSDPRPIAALRHLRSAWPSAVAFSELAAAALAQAPMDQQDPEKNALALSHVIETCHSMGIVELWTHPTSHISPVAGPLPRATRWARWQAVHLPRVTTLRHTGVNVEEIIRHVLPLLDGTRDRQALAEELVRRNIAAGEPESAGIASTRDPQKAMQLIEIALPTLASLALLVS